MTPQILLVLTLIMPPTVQDIRLEIAQETIDECWDNADDYIEAGLTKAMRAIGGIGVMAACVRVPAVEKEL